MTIVVVNNTLVVKIEGDMDHHVANFARQSIDHEIKSRPIKNLVFDFSELEFMDSSGVGMILGRYKIIKGLNGKVSIACARQSVLKIVNISGLHKIIPVYDDVQQAVHFMCEVI